MFSCRQAVESIGNFFPSQFHRVFQGQSLDLLRDYRTAGERRWTTIGEEPHGMDATVANSQTQPQTVAADGVRFLCDRVCIRKFAGIARVREVVFECL